MVDQIFSTDKENIPPHILYDRPDAFIKPHVVPITAWTTASANGTLESNHTPSSADSSTGPLSQDSTMMVESDSDFKDSDIEMNGDSGDEHIGEDDCTGHGLTGSLGRRAISEGPRHMSEAVQSLSQESLTAAPAGDDLELARCDINMDAGLEDIDVSWNGARDFMAPDAFWKPGSEGTPHKRTRSESLGASNLEKEIASRTSPAGSDLLARKRAKTSATIERPYISLTKWPESELSQYQAVSYRSIDSLARSHGGTGPRRTVQEHVNSRPKKLRKLDEPLSWEEILAWGSETSPHLPSELEGLLKVCEETKNMRPASESCPCLQLISLRWCEVLGSMFCEEHFRLVPGNYIWKHVGRSHTFTHGGITKATFLKAVLYHAVRCHPAIKDQSTPDVKSRLPVQLEAPLSHRPRDLLMRYKCPLIGCPTWTHQNNSRGSFDAEHIRHFKTHTAQERASCSSITVVAQWTQMVEIGSGKGKSHDTRGDKHYFTFPSTFEPSMAAGIPRASSFTVVDLAAPSTQNWPTALGWEDYISTLARGSSSRVKIVEKLRDLVALPSKARVEKCRDEVTMAVERGLLLSNALNLTYMQDGVMWVNGMHSMIRARFSHKV
jgi:hypothetical protein